MAVISIADAADLLRRGELVAFPTETVYGLGANALDASAVAKIYKQKGRPTTSPLIVHVSSLEMAKSLVAEWPLEADQLAHAFWPGPLTLVLPKKESIPDIVTAGLASVGIRVPNHALALELIRQAGVPLAAPSANRFMALSPTIAEHVCTGLGADLPIVDGGPCAVGIESSVIRIANGVVTLLRPGGISREQIAKAIGREVELFGAGAAGAEDAHPPLIQTTRTQAEIAPPDAYPAPGMHARHYSPRTPLVLVKDPAELPQGLGAYVYYDKFSLLPGAHMPADPVEYAARLYGVLHELDSEGWAWIAVEAPPDLPEWAAVLDRLQRAAAKE